MIYMKNHKKNETRIQNQDEFVSQFGDQFNQTVVKNFWESLDEEYFRRFEINDIGFHIECLMELESFLWGLKIQECENSEYTLIWVGPDKLGFFALLSGIIAGLDYGIESGDIFSFRLKGTMDKKNDLYRLFNRPLVLDILRIRSTDDFETVSTKIRNKILELFPGFFAKGLIEVRSKLQYGIGQIFSKSETNERPVFLPLDIQFRNNNNFTDLLVSGQDSHAFLFVLSTVLSMRGLDIIGVKIRTRKDRLMDKISLVDRMGRPIDKIETQEAVRRDVLLVKQFIHFLNQAPDYQLAFQNFFSLLQKSNSDDWASDEFDISDFFSKLAKILGTGNFLWEEFSKVQFKELRPLLVDDAILKGKFTKKKLALNFKNEIENSEASNPEEVAILLNKIKDKELFRLDLNHLVFQENTFEDFSRELCDLAEVSLTILLDLAHQKMSSHYGYPQRNGQIILGALLALGKFGGVELGYASDLELVFVFEGSGKTNNEKNSISNKEYFNKLILWLQKNWKSKSDGIFEIDWRLRPYGDKGAWSANYDFWCDYYTDVNKAHAIEVQSMTKMRGITGSPKFLKKCIAFRDDIVYHKRKIDKEAFKRMRKIQIEKNILNTRKINAKYSPGGLVDIEYTLQFMQMEYGGAIPLLRKSNLLKTLRILLENHFIEPTLFEKINNAYAFQRRLINSLRIVRGSAKDLELPQEGSIEWEFLERRMGYFGRIKNPYGSSLKDDLNFHFKQVRLFYEEYFEDKKHEILHRGGLPELLEGLLSSSETEKVLSHYGVKDFDKALNLLQRIYELSSDRHSMMSILVITARNIRHSADPEGVLVNFERLMTKTDEIDGFLRLLLESPEVLSQTILVFSYSTYLSGVLVQNPLILFELNNTEILYTKKTKEQFRFEILEQFTGCETVDSYFEALREYRNVEYIRIFLRDIDLKVQMHELTEEISDLSMALSEISFETVFTQNDQASLLKKVQIIALGKLGARELNYSSDIDLVYFWDDDKISPDDKFQCEKTLRKCMRLMTASSQFGQLFRVDTALRPHGQQGGLIATRKHYLDYYENQADGWELQAWIKSSAFWSKSGGINMIHSVQEFLVDPERQEYLHASVARLRKLVLERNLKQNSDESEIKNGTGGLRTLEFYLQKYSIEWSHRPDFALCGNSLEIIYRAKKLELLDPIFADKLRDDYCYLREVEHLLQIENMQQRHTLPDSPKEFRILAKRKGYRSRLDKKEVELFRKKLIEIQTRVKLLHDKLYGNF